VSVCFRICFSCCVQYLSRKNIKVFLDTCRSHIGLKDADLFHVPDLFDGTDFVKVNYLLLRPLQSDNVW